MNQKEREQLQAVADGFGQRDDECAKEIVFLDEHNFKMEKQVAKIRQAVYRECFMELSQTLCRIDFDSGLELNNELIGCIYETVVMLTRHAYFSDQLWRKLPGRENEDKVLVETAFLSRRLAACGLYVSPCGASYGCISDKENCTDNLMAFSDIWMDYDKWCNEQR